MDPPSAHIGPTDPPGRVKDGPQRPASLWPSLLGTVNDGHRSLNGQTLGAMADEEEHSKTYLRGALQRARAVATEQLV